MAPRHRPRLVTYSQAHVSLPRMNTLFVRQVVPVIQPVLMVHGLVRRLILNVARLVQPQHHMRTALKNVISYSLLVIGKE